jgi:glycosyltransferase involved in cell wall biosynthesis
MTRETGSRDPRSGPTLIVDQVDISRPAADGIMTVIRGYIEHCPRAEVRLLCARSDQGPLGEEVPLHAGARTAVAVPISRIKTRRLAAPNSLRLALALLRRAADVRHAEQVHVHRVELGAFLFGVLRIRPVQYIHNDAANLLGRGSDSAWRFLAPIYRAVESYAARHCLALLVFNSDAHERLSGRGFRATRCMTWFDPSLFYPATGHRRDGPLRVLWVGRLERQKDPLLAVDVSLELTSLGVSHNLTIVGDGSLREALKRKLAQHPELPITTLGAMQPAAVAEQMRRSDILLLTSQYEGSANVLVEANACGLWVATPQVADPDRWVMTADCGLATPTRNARELAQAVAVLRDRQPPIISSEILRRRPERVMIDIQAAISEARQMLTKSRPGA